MGTGRSAAVVTSWRGSKTQACGWQLRGTQTVTMVTNDCNKTKQQQKQRQRQQQQQPERHGVDSMKLILH